MDWLSACETHGHTTLKTLKLLKNLIHSLMSQVAHEAGTFIWFL